jgi:hypothetical protein
VLIRVHWWLLGENRGEFKIDDAKASVTLAIGHVAHVGIVVAHAELFEFGEKFGGAFLVKMLDAAAAIRGDDAKFFRTGIEKFRDEVAIARFKKFENAGFIFKPFFGVRAVINFDNTTVDREIHRRTQCVFDLKHFEKVSPQIWVSDGTLKSFLRLCSKQIKVDKKQQELRRENGRKNFSPVVPEANSSFLERFIGVGKLVA